MVDEVSVLGIKVDSRQVVKADKDLDRLAKTSDKVEKSTLALTAAAKKAAVALNSEGTAAKNAAKALGGLDKNTNGATKSIASLSSSTKKTAVNIRSTSKAAAALSINIAKVGASTRATKNSMDALDRSATKIAGSMGAATAATRNYSTALGTATGKTTAFAGATQLLTSAFVTFIALRGAVAIKDYSDEFTSVQNRIKQVTDSTEELNAVTDQLFKLSKDTRTSISATSTLYQRLTIAAEELNLTSGETLRITETINKAFAVSGATAQETAGAIRQLSQGLAAGALRGDEFNSVAEQAPIIMRAIAKETRLTIGELREFAATGGITADIIISALQNLESEIDVAFAQSIATFGQKIELVVNDMIKWAGASKTVAVALNATAVAIGVAAVATTVLVDNLDLLLALMIARQVPALLAMVAGMNALAIATVAVSAVFTTLGAAFTLIGGAAGVATLAAFALFKFATSAETAEEKAKNLTLEINELTGAYENLSLAQLTVISTDITQKMLEVDTATKALKAELQRLSTDTSVQKIAGEFQKLVDEIEKNEKELTGLEKKLLAVGKLQDQIFSSVASRAITESNKALKAQNILLAEQEKATRKVIVQLAEQVFFIGQSEREIAFYNAVMAAKVQVDSEDAQAIKFLNDQIFDNIELTREAAKAARELERAQERAARRTIEEWTKTRDFMAGVFVQMFDNGKSAFDDIFIAFKQMIKMMIATAAANQILLAVGLAGAPGGAGGVAAGGSLAASAAGSSVGGALAGLGAGSSLTNLFGGGLAPGAAGPAIPLSLAATNAIEAFGPAVAAFAGAVKGFEQAGLKGGVAGAAGGFGGAKAGAALGTLLGGPGIGTAIGTAIGGFIGAELGSKVFGGEFETRDFGLKLAVAAGDLVAFSFEKQKKEGGLFGSTERRVLTRDLDADAAAGFNQAFEGIQSQIIQSYSDLGIELGDEVFAGFSLAVEKISTKGKTDEQVTAAVAEFFGRAADEMAVFAGDVSLPFESLVALSEQFKALTETRSPFEKLGDDLNEAFAAINLELPATRAGFIGLIEGLDKTTASGLAATAALIGLAEPVEAFFDEQKRRIGLFFGQIQENVRIAEETAQQQKAAFEEFWTGFFQIIADASKSATDDALSVLKQSISERQALVKAQLSEDVSAEKSAFKERSDALRAVFETQFDGVAASISTVSDSVNQLRGLSGGLRSVMESLRLEDSRLDRGRRRAAQAQIGQAITAARGGAFVDLSSIEPALDEIARPSKELFSTFEDYVRDFAATSRDIAELSALTDSELTLQERTLAALESRKTDLRDILQIELDDNRTLHDETIEALNQNAELEIERLALIGESMAALVDAERGISNGAVLLADAIAGLTSALKTESSITTRLANQNGDARIIGSQFNIIRPGDAPGFAHGGDFGGGLRMVGELGPELERTGSSKIMSNADLMKALGGNKETAKEVRELKEVIKSIAFRNVPNLQDIVDVLEDWDNRGIPAERTA